MPSCQAIWKPAFAVSLAALTAAACAPGSGTTSSAQVSKSGAALPAALDSAPPLAFLPEPAFSAPKAAAQGNAALIRDFIDLSFEMESGRSLAQFSRFEGPITVAVSGIVPASAGPELTALISRLRREAGIDIRAATPGEPATITVHFAPRAQLRRLAPSAACFVVPNAATPEEYTALRGRAEIDWANVVQRRKAGIFLPAEASPQEVRDCLNEEIAQAIGPLNDLYRLSNSVFNDDNFHAVLTGFDMLILRAYYAPELHSGKSRQEVAAALPAIFARINPAGGRAAPDIGTGTEATSRAWKSALETALGAGGAETPVRKIAADRALRIAHAAGWTDNRLALSHFAVARLYVISDQARAAKHFAAAAEIYRRLPGTEIHLAHIEIQLAASALAANQPKAALTHADRAIPVIKAAQNPALLATTFLIKAEALDRLGRAAEAEALRMDSQQWASYGFGSDAQVLQRRREIAVLAAQGSRG